MKRKKTQNLGLKQRLRNSSPAEREDLIAGLPYQIGRSQKAGAALSFRRLRSPPASSQIKVPQGISGHSSL